MKKILLFSLILSFGLVSFAQKSSSLKTKEQRQVKKTAVHNPITISDLGNLVQTGNATVANPNAAKLEGFEVIGHTWYDFQSNTAVDNRMCTFDDGTMAAVWTFGTEGELQVLLAAEQVITITMEIHGDLHLLCKD